MTCLSLCHVVYTKIILENLFRNGIVLAATITDSPSSASFMPLSRILSRCAFINNLKVKFDYGEDKVCVAMPVKRHYLFFNWCCI